MARRTASQTAFSVMLVFRHGPPQWLIGLEQFVTHPSETRSVRICGNVCGMDDGAVGAVEILAENVSPPLVLVLDDSNYDVVEAAVRVAMIKAGRAVDVPSLPPKSVLNIEDLGDLSIVKQVMTIAHDAL